MCGIFGAVHLENENPDDTSLINDLIELFYYRGPDGKGVYLDSRVSFGHVRLSIIDLSENASQPMVDADKEFVIIYNGEIYNYKEIRKELVDRGYRFFSQSDTEVIINAFKEWGENFIHKFNGMFAFALYKKKTKEVWIYRDRFGIKPLFYSVLKNKLVFSSEPKLIVRYFGEKFKLDPVAVSSYFSYRYPLGEISLFKGIKTLPPGYCLKVRDEDYEIKKYYELSIKSTSNDKGEEFYTEQVKELLNKSIKRRMISDVPYGAYLSGGIDSSIIVAIMSENSPFPIKTFTIGFKEKDYNEFYYAKLVSKMYSTEHYEIEVEFDDYFEAHEKISKMKGSPVGVPNEPLIYILSKYLKKHITVVLSGEGADELFGGYGRIFRSPEDFYKLSLFNEFGEKFEELQLDKELMELKKRLQIKYGELSNIKTPLDHFLTLYPYVKFEEKKKIFSSDFLNEFKSDNYMKQLFSSCFEKFSSFDLTVLYMYMFERFHLPGLLLRLDNATMGASVEGRVPFVDHELVEAVFEIPITYKLRWKTKLHEFASKYKLSDEVSEKYDTTKYILKKAFSSKIPEEIIKRKKMGFPVPLELWKREYYKKKLYELIIDDKVAKERGIYNLNGIKKIIKEGNSRVIFNLVSFELWMKNYYDTL